MKMSDHKPYDQDEAPEAPPRLVSALNRLAQEPVFIPPTVDEAVLRAARKHLEQPRQARPGWLRLMPWVTAAAAIVLLATIPRLVRQTAPAPARDVVLARWDLDQDGRVDILDAFVLARNLKQDGTRNLQCDVNGDGVVDERDVAAIAARAVKLDQGGRS